MKRFDDIIKEKLEGLEGPANPNAWTEFEPALNVNSTPFFGPLAAGIAATTVLTVLFTTMPDIRPVMIAEDTELHINDEDLTTHDIQEVAVFTNEDHEPQEVHKIALEPIAATQISTSDELTPQGANAEARVSKEPIVKTDEVPTEGILPEMNFSANGIQCINSTVRFNAELSKAAQVTWLMEGLHVYEGLSVEHNFTSAGNHTVRMVTTFDNGAEHAIEKVITIYDRPEASHSFDILDQTSCFSSKVEFAGTPGSNSYKWLIDGDTVGKGGVFEIELSKGLHTAGMHTVNKDGCTSFQAFPVRIENGFEPYIPTAFTPTNQDGKGDKYEVVGLENAASFKIVIMRASTKRVVFESSESAEWDGSIQGSVERPKTGEVFLMTIQVTDECGASKEIQKTITYL